MNKIQLSIIAITAMTFIACGGGGGGGSSSSGKNTEVNTGNTKDKKKPAKEAPQQSSYNVFASVSDYMNEYIRGDYRYCADINKNEQCDLDESNSPYIKDTKVKLSSFKGEIQTGNIILEPVSNVRINDSRATFASKSGKDNTNIEINLRTSIEVALDKIGLSTEQKNAKLKEIGFEDNSIKLNSDIANKNILKALSSTSNENAYDRLSKLLSSKQLKDIFEGENFNPSQPKKDIEKKPNLELTPKPTPTSRKKIPLNDTGVTKFFNGSTMQGSKNAEVENNFPDQDAEFGFDATDGGFKFTKLDAKGNALSNQNATSGYSCLKDERTGLIWEIKSQDKSSPNYYKCVFALDIQEPKYYSKELAKANELNQGQCPTGSGAKDLTDYKNSSYVKYLNANNYCGKSNWRLPSFNEHYNILNFGLNNSQNVKGVAIHSTLDESYFNDLPSKQVAENSDLSGAYYWTSSLTQGLDGETYYLKKIAIISPVSKYPFQKSSMNFCALHPMGTDDVACDSPEPLYLRLVSQGDR